MPMIWVQVHVPYLQLVYYMRVCMYVILIIYILLLSPAYFVWSIRAPDSHENTCKLFLNFDNNILILI